ncbi:MAG: hypothetical protein ACKVT2_19945 [Saprospiraceae bacterium]
MTTNIHQPPSTLYEQRRKETKALGAYLHATEFTFLRDNCNGLTKSAMPFELTSKKISGLPLRGYFFRNLFDMVQAISPSKDESKKLLFSTQLPFIAETLITIQYYSNQILDNKGGVVTKSRIDENLNSKENLEPALYDYIWQRVFLKDEERCDLLRGVNQILRLGAIGQVMEDKYTTYDSWVSSIEQKVLSEGIENYFDREILDFLEETISEYVSIQEDHRYFLRTYLVKIYLRNAPLFEILTQYVVKHSELDKHDQTRLRKFAILVGLLLPIVNDINDLVPSNRKLSTEQKTNNDAFADLRNNTLTLPMIIHLMTVKNSLMEGLLREGVTDLSLVPEEALLEELTQHHSVFKAMSIAKDIQKKAATYLPLESGLPRDMFLDMLRIAENNKYFKHFYNKMQDYKAYKKLRRENKTLSAIGNCQEAPTLVPA